MTRVATEQDRQDVIRRMSDLDLAKPWDVKIQRPTRTHSQNAMMWRWISEISKYTGYDKDDIHEYLKAKFLEPRVSVIRGVEIVRHTTTGLTTDQMAEYMDHIYRWAQTELNIRLPIPEDRIDRR